MRAVLSILGLLAAVLTASAQGGPPIGPIGSSSSVAGSPSAAETASGLYNVNATTLLHWRKAVANVRSGAGRGRLLVMGDSTSAGSGAGTSGTLDQVGAFPLGWVQQLGPALSKYVPANNQSFMCDQAVSVGYGAYDTRVTIGANWAFNQGGCIGGNLLHYLNTGVSNVTFTPVGSFDTLNIFYMGTTGNGTFSVNVDGGASLGTLNCATPSYNTGTFTATVPAGPHTINIVPNNNGACYLLGAYTQLSTSPAIDIIQSAVNGATAFTFDQGGNPWNALQAIVALAPDAAIISLTINDSNGQTALATYTSQMQAVISAVKAIPADCILVPGAPSNTIQATNGTLAQYLAVNRSLAASNGCAMIDIPTRWVSWANTNPVMPYYDSLHPQKLGYSDIATAAAQVLGNP